MEERIYEALEKAYRFQRTPQETIKEVMQIIDDEINKTLDEIKETFK